MRRILRGLTVTLLLLSGCAVPEVDLSAPAIATGVDPEAWVAVPAGPFPQGQHEQEGVVEEGYEIMVTDVTNAQYARFLNAALSSGEVEVVDGEVRGYYPGDDFRGHEHEREIAAGTWIYALLDDPAARITYDGTSFSVWEGYANHPATFVSWFGAWGYCRHYGWRLPTDLEWEKAARGTDARPFPWGHEITGEDANFVYRPWCRFLCPFGLVSWGVEQFSRFRPRVDREACKSCRACVRACPSGAMADFYEGRRVHTDCFACGACLDACRVEGALEWRRP